MHPQQWLEPLEPIFTWLPHSNMYPIVLYNYYYLSRTRKKLYIIITMFFIIIIISISIIYTLLEFCYTHLKSHYYDYVFFTSM